MAKPPRPRAGIEAVAHSWTGVTSPPAWRAGNGAEHRSVDGIPCIAGSICPAYHGNEFASA
jgi:hypothetical protein